MKNATKHFVLIIVLALPLLFAPLTHAEDQKEPALKESEAVKVEGEELLVMREDDIMAVIDA